MDNVWFTVETEVRCMYLLYIMFLAGWTADGVILKNVVGMGHF